MDLIILLVVILKKSNNMKQIYTLKDIYNYYWPLFHLFYDAISTAEVMQHECDMVGYERYIRRDMGNSNLGLF
jgi:hypothetical protein